MSVSPPVNTGSIPASQGSSNSNTSNGSFVTPISTDAASPSKSGTSQASVTPSAPIQVTTNASTPPAFIPSAVILALSDRALGATTDPGNGARVYLRETNSASTQFAAIESIGAQVISAQAYLSGVQATAPGEQFLPVGIDPPLNLTALSSYVVTRVADIESALFRATLAGASEIPEYSNSLMKLFDSWQFGNHAPKPSLPIPEQHPAVVSVPTTVDEFVEQPTTASDVYTPETSRPPWYQPGNVGRVAIVVLTMILVALRIHNWRAASGVKSSQKNTKGTNPPPVLQEGSSSGD